MKREPGRSVLFTVLARIGMPAHKASVCAETAVYTNSGFGIWDAKDKLADCVCTTAVTQR